MAASRQIAVAQAGASEAALERAHGDGAQPGGGDTFDVDGLVAGTGQPGGPSSDATTSEPREPPPTEPLPREPGSDPQPERKPSLTSREPRRHEPRRRPTPAPPARAVKPPGERAAKGEHRTRSGDAAGEGDASAGGPGAGRQYGDASGERGVRNLARTFARALPAAVSGQRAWAELPTGHVGAVDATFVVDADGKIRELVVQDGVAPALAALVNRTRGLLLGELSLTGHAGKNAGRETLRIDVTLSQVPATEDDDGTRVLLLGHEPPSAGKPGRAYFVLASGRRFDATIRIVTTSLAD